MSWSASPPSPPTPPTPPSPPSPEYLDQFDAQQLWYDEQMRGQRDYVDHPGVAFHVHRAFNNIRENLAEIMETLGGVDPNLYKEQNDMLNEFYWFCSDVLHDDLPVKRKEAESRLNGKKLEDELKTIDDNFETSQKELKGIISKLGDNPNTLSQGNISNMTTWLNFLLQQPPLFQIHYVEIFIPDTYHAYDGMTDTISCIPGILERMLFSIADACILHCLHFKKKQRRKPKSSTKKRKDREKNKERIKQAKRKTAMKGGARSLYKLCDNLVYRKLIRLFKKEVPDLNSLSKDWAVILDDKEIAAMTPDNLKQHFIEFMVRQYERYGIKQTDQINKRADEYEEAQVFLRKEFG